MRQQNIPFSEIAKRLGKKPITCSVHLGRIRRRFAARAWDDDMERGFRAAYERKKREFYKSIADEIGFNGDWRVLEVKARSYESEKKK